MEVSPGYKNSVVGVIPEEWHVRTLGELGEAVTGLTYKPSDVREHGTLVLRSSNIQNVALSFDDNVFVDVEIPDRLKARPGDVLICVRNGSRSLIGKTALLDERALGMTFGAFMAVYRSPIGRLASYLFQSEILKRQINEHLGATINQITNKSLRSFSIPVSPDEAEREAIAAALSDVDALINEIDRLIAKKRDIKQATMQRLLTGQTRLPGFSSPWNESRLGACGSFMKGSGVKKSEANGGSLPCVRYGELYTHHENVIREFYSSISAQVASTAMRLQRGDVLFAGSGETKEEIGKCAAFTSNAEAYAGGDIVILRGHSQEPTFMGYYLNSPAVVAQKASRGQGDAVVHISARALGDIVVRLPGLDEQTAIARVLSDMDAELAALEARRDKTRNLKQGIMQELLTGRTRLV
jgi:type I restriction enzyme S subunit